MSVAKMLANIFCIADFPFMLRVVTDIYTPEVLAQECRGNDEMK